MPVASTCTRKIIILREPGGAAPLLVFSCRAVQATDSWVCRHLQSLQQELRRPSTAHKQIQITRWTTMETRRDVACKSHTPVPFLVGGNGGATGARLRAPAERIMRPPLAHPKKLRSFGICTNSDTSPSLLRWRRDARRRRLHTARTASCTGLRSPLPKPRPPPSRAATRRWSGLLPSARTPASSILSVATRGRGLDEERDVLRRAVGTRRTRSFFGRRRRREDYVGGSRGWQAVAGLTGFGRLGRPTWLSPRRKRRSLQAPTGLFPQEGRLTCAHLHPYHQGKVGEDTVYQKMYRKSDLDVTTVRRHGPVDDLTTQIFQYLGSKKA